MRESYERTRQAEESETAWATQRADVDRWRRDVRPRVLRAVADRTTNLRWSPKLLAALLDELYIDDDFVELVGDTKRLPVRRYPHAVATALAIRHSWRPDDLSRLTRRLGVSLATARSGPSAPHSTRRRHGARMPHTTRVRRPKPARR